MSQPVRNAVVALLVLGLLIGLLFQPSGREFSASSYGAVPHAYGAFHDSLLRLDIAVERNLVGATALPAAATVWWIGAPQPCDRVEGEDPQPWEGTPWLEAGGTAIVFVPERGCERLAGLTLPKRLGEQTAPPAAATPELHGPKASPTPAVPDGWSNTLRSTWETDAKRQAASGDLVPVVRHLETPGLQAFATADGWQVRAHLDDQPFVLQRQVGAGQLVLVADGRFLSNFVLDRADNAVLGVDLVQAFGVPHIDEHGRGFRRHDGVLRYLMVSSALPLFAGMLALGLLFVWYGRSMPLRRVEELDRRAPTLSVFVDSLAALYRRSPDHDAVLAAYRGVTVARLRRVLRLSHEVGEAEILRRLRRLAHLDAAEVAELERTAPVADAADLLARAEQFDRLLWKVGGK